MIYSEDRIKNLAFLIHDRLYMNEDVDYTDDNKALARLKAIMLDYFAAGDQIDAAVRRKISSLKRNVMRGTDEWDILYQQYKEEEMRKRKS